MVEIAKVNLWNMEVGIVSWDTSRNIATFQYYPDFVQKGIEPAPIMMPAFGSESVVYEFPALSKETYLGLPGMLADSLPDKFGNEILNTWLIKQGRTAESLSPIERLCYVGNRGMGALEFAPPTYKESKAQKIDIEEMTALVRDIIAMRGELQTNAYSESMIKDIISIGTSAGGARAKAVIAFDKNTGEIRSGQLKAPKGFEHWLLKFDGTSESAQGFGRIEYAYYKMAQACEITMSECRLLEIGDHAHFMTKRFDRAENKKIHLQSLCGIAHYDFNTPVYSYEALFDVMRKLRLKYADAEQMFRRMVFNVIAYNRDDHTKNTAFLMDESGMWSLAPAYDITYAYRPDSPWVARHQMSINGKRDGIKDEDLLRVAELTNIKKPKEIIQQIKEVVSGWAEIAQSCGVTEGAVKEIGKVVKE
jgi:serine/threonine-protein kinase HipA